MTRSQKLEIGKTITKIISGNFVLADVKALFIDLRDYVDNDPIFKEYANFVAHPERKVGVIHQEIEFYYHKLTFIKNYLLPNIVIDPYMPFPDYIHRMYTLVIPKIDPGKLREFRLKEPNLRNFLNQQLHKVDDKTYELSPNVKSRMRQGTVVPEWNILYQHINNFGFLPAINLSILMDSLVRVLNLLRVQFNEFGLRSQSNKIMLLILGHLHKSKYILKDGKTFELQIDGLGYRRIQTENVDRIESRHLCMSVSVVDENRDLNELYGNVGLSPILFTTPLTAYEWCAPEVFVDHGQAATAMEDQDFKVENFKLFPILPYEGSGILQL